MALECRLAEFLEAVRGEGVEAWETEARPTGGLDEEGRWWPYPLDAWPLLSLALLEGRARAPRVVVARPGSVDEVAAVVRAAAGSGVCLLPRGGGSGVLGGLAPRDCCAVLDLSRLDWVEPHVEDGYVYTGAGTLLSRLEEELGRLGYTTGLEPQSLMVASVGGLVSTLAAGALQPGYGNIEDVLLFVDLVDGEGRALRLGSPSRPRPLGPGCGAFAAAGAEGAVGVVTGVGLRIRRLPRYAASATFSFPGVPEALGAARRLVQWNQPAVLRIVDEYEAQLLYGAEGTLLITAYYDDEDPGLPERLLAKAARVAEGHGGRETGDIYEKWREKRYDYASLVKQVSSMGLWFDTIDMQAPWSRLPELYKAVMDALRETRGVMAAFSHISHFNVTGGSLYTTVVVERRVEALAEAWRRVMEAVERHGGSVTHHHGVGLQKLYWVARERRDELRTLCGLKRILDPRGVLQPHGLAAHCRQLEGERSR